MIQKTMAMKITIKKMNLQKKGIEIRYPLSWAGFGVSVWLKFGSISPCFCQEPVKTSKQKLAGNAAQHNKVQENFCF
jgi:hypothetical protein